MKTLQQVDYFAQAREAFSSLVPRTTTSAPSPTEHPDPRWYCALPRRSSIAVFRDGFVRHCHMLAISSHGRPWRYRIRRTHPEFQRNTSKPVVRSPSHQPQPRDSGMLRTFASQMYAIAGAKYVVSCGHTDSPGRKSIRPVSAHGFRLICRPLAREST